jgi:hypothetical protein
VIQGWFLSSGWDSLTWGVTLGGHIISGLVVYFTSSGTAGVGSPTTSAEVTTESCSSVVTLILILSSEFSPSHLLSPELSYFSPNFSFNHWLANLPHNYNSFNFSNSLL